MSFLPFIPLVGQIIDKVFPDKQAAEKAKLELYNANAEFEKTLLEAQKEVIKTEAASEHKLAATWRPILMLVIVAIIGNNYLLAPYVSLLFGVDVALELPEKLWDLVNLGVGGYVAGRSAEKLMRTYKGSE